MKTLIVSEQFYSIQGEGRTMGIPAFFLRLAGCNLMCGGQGTDRDKQLHHGATWRCDTIEVWKKGKSKAFQKIIEDFKTDSLTLEDIMQLINEKFAHLVITGGEPLMHQQGIADFMDWLVDEVDMHPIVEIETNGTKRPIEALDIHIDYFNVSPKLRNSGEPEAIRFNDSAMRWFAEDKRAIFKFVVSSPSDIDEVVNEWIRRYDLPPLRCYLMPAADNEQQLREVSQFVAEQCKNDGFRFSSRLHLAIWDRKTGV